MARKPPRVVAAGNVTRFAKSIAQKLAVHSEGGPFEAPGNDPAVAAALVDLREAVEVVKEADRGDGVLFAPNHRTAALMMSFLASHAPETADSQGVWEAQLAGDVGGWVTKFVPAWLKGRFTRRRFVAPSPTPSRVPNHFRVAVLGDWGSGLYGAPLCAVSIQTAEPAFDRLLHLGDVYYAGTKHEVVERFLNLWPDVPGASSWTLNSNHEMYSGGEGYFDVTLADQRFAQQNRSSCFAWENDYFLFLGLDTGYDEHDIGDEQRSWILEVSSATPKKLVIFSHHQPFSAFESSGPKLVSALEGLLQSRRIAAWYWGHEHRCVFFERHPTWSLWGRCVGHGGYPERRAQFEGPPESTNKDRSSWRNVCRAGVPDAWVLDGPNPYVVEHPQKYAPNGYVALHFDGPIVHEKVHSPTGTLLLAKDIS